MARWRKQDFICDLGFSADTPLAAHPAVTPDCEPHSPWPVGYIAASEYADVMMETHVQRQCKGCSLWLIWEPK
jgi:hypothetical protein